MRRRERKRRKKIFKVIFKIILSAVFLKLSYDYFMEEGINAFFTTLVPLPLINQVVQSWVYWLIVLGIVMLFWYLWKRCEEI